MRERNHGQRNTRKILKDMADIERDIPTESASGWESLRGRSRAFKIAARHRRFPYSVTGASLAQIPSLEKSSSPGNLSRIRKETHHTPGLFFLFSIHRVNLTAESSQYRWGSRGRVFFGVFGKFILKKVNDLAQIVHCF